MIIHFLPLPSPLFMRRDALEAPEVSNANTIRAKGMQTHNHTSNLRRCSAPPLLPGITPSRSASEQTVSRIRSPVYRRASLYDPKNSRIQMSDSEEKSFEPVARDGSDLVSGRGLEDYER